MISGFVITNPYSLCQARVKNLFLLALFTLLLSGCAQLIRTEQPQVANSVALSFRQTVGQTFVAKYNGLSEIFFYLIPQENGNGVIRLHLRSQPDAEYDLAVSTTIISIDAVKTPGYYGFFIPAQINSNQKYYYVFLEADGNGKIRVGDAPGVAYINGALYQDGKPEDAQAAFQLRYSRRQAVIGVGLEALTWIGYLFITIFLFILPGWGLFCLLWPGWLKLTYPEKLGLSAGLSLAIYPLLFLWTYIVGLHFGAMYAWVPPLAGLGMILWKNRKDFHINGFTKSKFITFLRSRQITWSDVVYLFILGLLVFTRFWTIRSLDVPMWGDSYQHTMIAQLIVDHGGLFTSWQPYAEMTTFTYHFGFHTSVAVFDWITHLGMPKAVLIMGQIVNLLAVITLYPLATKVGRNQWAGVLAVALAGLLSPMPMYYVNWGRYTQLAGQIILPVVAWSIWTIFTSSPLADSKGMQKGMIAVGCILLGGLALTHYRVLIFALVFLAVFWILYARRGTLKSIFLNTLWVGSGAFLLFLPWFIRIFGGRIVQMFVRQMGTSATQAVEIDPQLAGAGNVFMYLPPALCVLLVISICIGLWRHEKSVILICLWWIVNLLAGNPSWLGLPGAAVVNNFTVVIALYIPAGIIIGAAVSWFDSALLHISGLHRIYRYAFSSFAALLILGGGIWLSGQRIEDVQPAKNALVARPDILAAQWMQKNTNPNARILVNSFAAYKNSVIVGSDGGWWLPLLALRQNTVPPLNYSFEQGPTPDYRTQINALTFEIQTKGIQSPDVLAQLKDRGISYVYIGQRQGKVNSANPLFTAGQLLADPNFGQIYHQDMVWIFQVHQVP